MFTFTLVIGKVNLHGHFGPSYVDEKGEFHKGIELLDVVDKCESFKNPSEIVFSINSRGGYVDVGNDIYDYMIGLKDRGIKITTVQDGLVGSIATKAFLAGDKRIVDDRYEFWIHNPFRQNFTGDADQMRMVADDLEKTETKLRDFYAQFTTINDSGLDALMKKETGMSADQCITFGFGTEKKEIPAFNLIKKNTAMPKTEKKIEKKEDAKSFMDHVMAFFNTPPTGAKNMLVTLAEGAGAFWAEGDLVVGTPVFMVDENGDPTAEKVPAETYTLEDGTMVTVDEEGMISAVTPVEEEPAEAFTADQVNAIVAEAVAKATAELNAKMESQIAEVKNDSAKQILAMKKDLRIGVPPKKPAMGAPETPKKANTINQAMAEIRERVARK